MPRGYRCIFIAAVGWLILANGKVAENKHGNTAAPATSPTPAPTPPYAPYTDRYADACYKAENHDTADLCAQWRAAIAAEKAADASSASVTWAALAALISVVTAGGLIFTIMQTQGALKEARRGNRLNLLAEKRSRRKDRESSEETNAALTVAKRNAAAAAKLAKVTADNSRKELRAYLDFDTCRVDVTQREVSGVVGDYVGVRVILKNFGKTPAENVEIDALYGRFSKGIIAAPTQNNKAGVGGVAPLDTLKFGDYFLVTKEQLSSFMKGAWQIHMQIEVRYCDAFGTSRVLAAVYKGDGRDTEMAFTPHTRINT